jgi:hypothetical protein
MRRHLWLACLIGASVFASGHVSWSPENGFTAPGEAEASVAVAYSLEDLVAQSPQAIVAEAMEQNSTWEKVGGSKRIVTYTRLELRDNVYGDAPGELWVRTLGGAVGKIGQSVAGEASFTLGKQSLVFLTKTKGGTWVVSGAAQGHYPVVEQDDDAPRLALSPLSGKVVKKKKTKVSVQESLAGQPVADGVDKIRAAKAKVDGEE